MGDPKSEFAQNVAQLSRLFTKDRTALSRSYLDSPELAAAYLRYFLPVNLSKIQVLLDEMPTPQISDTFSVLDLGSGPGSGALGVLDWWHRRRTSAGLSVVALDRSRNALQHARQLWDGYCRGAGLTGWHLETYDANIEQGTWLDDVRAKSPFDLIMLANCLNEMHADERDPIEQRTHVVRNALSLLAPHGTMMIVEPALRQASRELHQLRDRLVQEKHCTIYSPCLHEGNCPALVKPDDWCHEERPWDPPASIQEIDEEVGFIKDALKFSYLLLRKDGRLIVERRPNVYRVVSELRALKGEKRAWLCNELGRSEVGRQDRLASPQNAAFDEWHRGAIVQIERIVRKEKAGKVSSLGRIEQDGVVKLVQAM